MKKTVERIKEYLDYKAINNRQFEIAVGFSNGAFGSQLKNKKNIGSDKIENILNVYPDINPEWLLTGTGEMLKNGNILAKSAELNNKEYEKIIPIPFVTPQAVAGFGNSNFAIEEQDVKEYYVIPKFKHRKVDFMIEVYGNSMYPKYNSGDIVAATIINNSHFIQWNKPHVIATNEQGILVKRICQGKDDDNLLLKSDNKDYPPFNVPKTDITGIALVVGVIRLE